ncbi:hypothetical protein, partial [Escherichia coli]|uniref:hypothetical protein n=1 Tax=Escherichia coli TaxID=562 RepID=UPI0013D25613
QLNCIADLIHRPLGNSGETPYTLLGAQARFLSKGASPPKLKAEGLATLTRDEEQVLVSAISEFGALLAA